MTMRHEYKYPLAADQDALLAAKAAGLLLRDPHADDHGRYVVRSLYLDDLHDSFLRDGLAERDPRAKYRLRYYGDDPTTLRLEKKTKYRDRCRKESCLVSPDEYEALLRGEYPDPGSDAPEQKRRLLTEVFTRTLQPSVIVAYEREAFVYPAGNVRITFDRAVTSSCDTDRFLTRDEPRRPIYGPGVSLMEVKFDGFLPRHIRGAMQIDGLVRTSFSKYVRCRLIHL